jgi:cell fate regulator YaaT (PSP1 superfamily)
MAKYVVRYGIMRSLGVLTARGRDAAYVRGDRVVARTQRGLEAGEILCEASGEALTQLKDSEQGEILRGMSTNDENELGHLQAQEGREFSICLEYVKQLGLQMELVDLEHVFGGERIIVYYLAEQRVDFRDLVRQLAKEFQTRIEMRQIGVRDEAKLLADYGDCGKPVCCNTHLTTMPPVSMKMAKLQKATLDPTKISGRCGRLKCCLRYEFETYEELRRELPPVGSEIVTELGKAVVLGQEILTRQLLIETEDNRRVLIDADGVLSITRRGGRRRQQPSQDKAGGQNEENNVDTNKKDD